jgi:hypothetical protein
LVALFHLIVVARYFGNDVLAGRQPRLYLQPVTKEDKVLDNARKGSKAILRTTREPSGFRPDADILDPIDRTKKTCDKS